MVSFLLGAVLGFAVGGFTPAVGRKIKSLFVKETTAAKTAVTTEATKIETDVKSKL